MHDAIGFPGRRAACMQSRAPESTGFSIDTGGTSPYTDHTQNSKCSVPESVEDGARTRWKRRVKKWNRKKIGAVLSLGLLFVGMLEGCSRSVTPERYSKQFLDVFDTVSMEIGFEKSEADFMKCYDASHAQLLKEHQLYDIYNSYEGMNNLKTVNDQAGIQPVAVDKDLLDLIKWGKEVYTLTDGKVNIAYGAVLKLWHEKREAGMGDPEHAELPDPEALEEAAKHTSIDDVIIDEAAGTLYLRDPEMSLDVGGIGKGYATERAAQLVKEEGAASFLLNLGGNVRAIGTKGDGSKWVCPVENPDYRDTQTGAQYAVTCYLEDRSLVTSGDYERYYTVNGQRYHHIIDPDTLYPATYHRSVSILTEDSGLADALSTALFMMSVEDGKKLITALHEGTSPLGPDQKVEKLEAMWIDADGHQEYTDGFLDYTKETG